MLARILAVRVDAWAIEAATTFSVAPAPNSVMEDRRLGQAIAQVGPVEDATHGFRHRPAWRDSHRAEVAAHDDLAATDDTGETPGAAGDPEIAAEPMK